jgi:hypothetical protein
LLTSLVVANSLASASALGQDKSLRQERNEARAQFSSQVEGLAYCVAFFDIDGDAAEVLELKTGVSKESARDFVRRFADIGRYFELAVLPLVHLCVDVQSCLDAGTEAKQRGLARGKADSQAPAIERVRDKFNSCSALLASREPQKVQTPPPQERKSAEGVTRQTPAAPNLAAVVTASELEGVRNKIRPCWHSLGASKDQNMVITLVVQMNQDGTPVKAELSDTSRYNRDPAFRMAADAAHRAIMNPRCQPWPLPPEKYNSWRYLTFNFDPRDY